MANVHSHPLKPKHAGKFFNKALNQLSPPIEESSGADAGSSQKDSNGVFLTK